MFAKFGISKFMNPMEGLADCNAFVIGDLRLDIPHNVLKILASESKQSQISPLKIIVSFVEHNHILKVQLGRARNTACLAAMILLMGTMYQQLVLSVFSHGDKYGSFFCPILEALSYLLELAIDNQQVTGPFNAIIYFLVATKQPLNPQLDLVESVMLTTKNISS